MYEEKLCLGCMNPIGGEMECPRCGYIEGTPRVLPALEPSTELADDRYLTGRKLHDNGEGFAYIAFDRRTGKKVILREYLPQTLATRDEDSDRVRPRDGAELAYRDYLEDFLEVARTVSRLGEVPSVAPVLDIFECNNTAYAVYEFIPGKPLDEVVKRAGRLTWDEARPIFLPVIASMGAAHAVGLVHFGLCPENLIMTKEGRVIIQGFGVPDAHIAETDLKAELFDGYSAVEQYALEGKKGKWTDVYALSAVMYFCLTGKRAPDAVARSYESRLTISTAVPAHVAAALSSGLQVKAENRTVNMDELKADLSRRPPETTGGMSAVRQQPAPQGRAPVDGWEGFVARVQVWLSGLNQLQYGMLSVGVTVVVLGLIALCVYPAIRGMFEGGSVSITEVGNESDSDLPLQPLGDLYPVPNFVGQKWNDIMSNADNGKFRIVQLKSDFSDNFADGVVMSQDVPPYTEVPAGAPVGLIISEGAKTRAI
ncbi:MAG: PASTA domain-containing protein, partial [Oscillospiraceae bacterium]|nr:PASTA domain-containing protein [Oscillospiraceae bacterium]